MKRLCLETAVLVLLAAVSPAQGADGTYGFDFTFSPSRSQLDVRMAPENPREGMTAEFKVSDVRDGKVVATFTSSADPHVWTSAKLPELDGDYEITMKVGDAEAKKRFERHHFPWEGNTLGKSETVYPPFTPIEVAGAGDGATLKTVLREHKLGFAGLPASIVAAGQELLAAPARLVTDEGEITGTFQVVSKKPNRVVTRAELEGPNCFMATAEGIWEEDGCLDWRLKLTSGNIKSLTLEIPLSDKTARMIHAIGRMRATTSAWLPKSEGVVWNADKTPQVIPHFCPYVYVGDQHRGFAWWAESPNGWGWSRKAPNCELVRSEGRVTLRVRLVDQETQVSTPRTIRMGMMAAPVKPRPKDWLTRWTERRYKFIATDICWFSESNCGGVQPAGGNLELWKWIGDCYLPGRQPDLNRIEEIMKPVDEYLKVYSEGDRKMLAGEFRRMMRQHEEWGRGKNQTPMFYYNRSVWNNCPEWNTYMGEWMQQMFNRPYGKGPSRNEIYIEPSGSYLDYACWWWKKSFDLCGNRGVYCDNYFLDGCMQSWNHWHPDGLGRNVIWALREQAKRVRQMMCELKMEPYFWPHMSSQALLPWMSYSEGQLDWEWNLGGGPLQRRFSREYLKLATWGEATGVIPRALMDSSKSMKGYVRDTFTAGLHLCGMTAEYCGDDRTSGFDVLVQTTYMKNKSLSYWNSFMDGKLPVKCSDPTVEWCVWCIPGERALLEALSWNKAGGQTAVFEIDYKALGLPEPKAKGAPLAENADGLRKELMGDDALDLDGPRVRIGSLDDQPVLCQDLVMKAPQPLGKQGFSVKFGPYGDFVGEITPARAPKSSSAKKAAVKRTKPSAKSPKWNVKTKKDKKAK